MVDAPLCAEIWEFSIFQKLGSSIRENYFWYGEQCNEVNYCIYDLLGCGSFAAFHNVWVGTELVNHDEVKLAHVLAEVHVEILEGVGGRFMPTNGLSWIAGFELFTRFTSFRKICSISFHKWPPEGLPGSLDHFACGLMHGQQTLEVSVSEVLGDYKSSFMA